MLGVDSKIVLSTHSKQDRAGERFVESASNLCLLDHIV